MFGLINYKRWEENKKMAEKNKISKTMMGSLAVAMSLMMMGAPSISARADEAPEGFEITTPASKNAKLATETKNTKVANNHDSNSSSTLNHETRDYEWVVIEEATETEEGKMAHQRVDDGRVAEYILGGGTEDTSAYAVFNRNAIEKIRGTQAGETVRIETDVWSSFTREVMECIAGRRDIHVEIQYKQDDKYYLITIPANAEVPSHVEYAGFNGYLAGKYGKKELV